MNEVKPRDLYDQLKEKTENELKEHLYVGITYRVDVRGQKKVLFGTLPNRSLLFTSVEELLRGDDTNAIEIKQNDDDYWQIIIELLKAKAIVVVNE